MNLLSRLFHHHNERLMPEEEARHKQAIIDQQREAEKALAPFIPGQFLYWCDGRCWGGVSTVGQRLAEGCPRCGGPLRLVATALKEPTPIETARKRKAEHIDPKKRNDLFILTAWKDPTDAA